MWVYEMPPQLAGMVETAADQIRAESSDYAVGRRALLWKADGIPTIYTAALRPDPLAGALDLWVLLYQMQDYFQDGAGKDAFGPQQPIAVETVRNMLDLVHGVAEKLYTDPDAYGKRKRQVQEFARAHPIEGAYYSARETALVKLARLVESEDPGMFSGLEAATDTLADVSLRLNAYVTLLPKVASWQAELTSEGVTGRENLGRTLDEIDAIGEMARRASGLLADLPGAARQVGGPLGELLDRQRVELLAAVDRERQDLMGFVSSERATALSAVGEERRAALEGVATERAAALAGVEAISKRSLEDASIRARGVVDYVFVRALILIALAALFFAVAYRLARGGRGSPRAADA